MTCPKCKSAMTPAGWGWICPKCGHKIIKTTIDMTLEMWYNIVSLLTEANKLRRYRSPLWGASVPMAIPIQSQGRDCRVRGTEVAQGGLLHV